MRIFFSCDYRKFGMRVITGKENVLIIKNYGEVFSNYLEKFDEGDLKCYRSMWEYDALISSEEIKLLPH